MSRPIALFIPSLAGGGAERVMSILANEFKRNGHSVDMVLVQAIGPYLKDLRQDINIVDLKARRTITSVLPLAKYLRARRPQVLLATLDHPSVVALMAKAISGVDTRVVIRLANVLSTSFSQAQTGRSRWVLASLAKRYYRRAERVIAVSQGVADDALKFASLSPEQVVTINNPVVLERVVEKSKEPLAESAFAPGMPPVILGVGRLTPQKDFTTLIRAFAEVRKSRDARLVIVGEGNERGRLKRLVAELALEPHVSMPGFAANPYAYMARAAVFVLSSRWEGFPNVLLEAMAVGTPVIATDCIAGPSDILEGGRYGRLVPVGDYKAMADAILDALREEPGPRPELQLRAEAFSPTAIAKQYEKILLNEIG